MLKYNFITISIVVLNLKSYCFCSTACKPKVAIIGAGIGGASTSHFLTELFNKNIEIDIFEADKVGGRLATVEFENDKFEAGGAVIHPRNKYMKDFVKLLNLDHRPPLGSRFGIWNGHKFVFKESDWESVTLMKLFYDYGMEPYYLHKYVSEILDDFEKIYTHQEKGIGFENVTALLGSMNEDFVKLLQISIKDHLIKLGYKEKLIDELVKATIVVNYGQDVNIHAFVACVSIAGAGFDLWSVKGGNKKVPELLISSNEKISLIHSTVKQVIRNVVENIPKYEVFFEKEGESNVTSNIYDIVIIATPMTSDQKNQIIFKNFNDGSLKVLGEYQTTIATFVKGSVNYSYFGLDEELGGIMSCDPDKTKISSIGELSSVEGKKNSHSQIWKVFSRKKLNDINKIFSQVNEVKEITWKAYPHYSSSMRFDKFKVDDFMYYVNAIEWAASAMEMSAIAGRNAAILAFNDYMQKCSSSTMNNHSANGETQTHSSEL